MSVGKGILAGVLVLGLLTGLGWYALGNEYLQYKFFAPKTEQVRHDVFKSSQAYNDAVAQELQNMQTQYLQADPAHKKLLAGVIIHTLASYDERRLPTHLHEFLEELRQKQAIPR